jgi:Uma2 family endonuclease
MAILWGMPEPAAPALMTADELFGDPRFAHGYELIEGRLVKMSPGGNLHGEIAQAFGAILFMFVRQQRLGIVVGAETGFVIELPGRSETVLAPDAAFIRIDRVPPRNSAERRKYLRLAPDLVVEVVSPNDTRPEVEAKAQFWLDAGVRLLWVAWPDTQMVEVWRSGIATATLTSVDMLDGYDVLPGFTHLVGDCFA